MKLSKFNLLFLFISCFSKAVFAEITGLTIENAWIAEAPPVSKVMVAYMTLNNASTSAIDIIHAESPTYSSIEFHETVHKNGMAGMVRHDSLNIAASNKLELKRGGPHIMLFNPVKTLKAGDSVKIKLTTKTGSSKTVSIPVKKAQY